MDPLSVTAVEILFARQTSAVSSVSPGLAILVGLLTAGGIHAVRTAMRPLVTGGTLGMGNPFVSAAEDGLAVVLATTSVIAPALALVLVVALLVAMYAIGRSIWRRAYLAFTPKKGTQQDLHELASHLHHSSSGGG